MKTKTNVKAGMIIKRGALRLPIGHLRLRLGW